MDTGLCLNILLRFVVLSIQLHVTKGKKTVQAIAWSQGKNPSFIAGVLLSVLLCHGHSDRKERGYSCLRSLHPKGYVILYITKWTRNLSSTGVRMATSEPLPQRTMRKSRRL